MFDAPTKLFSAKEIPLIHQVIPMIEKLEMMLKKVRDDTDKPPILRVAAIASLEVVGKYYARTDDTEVYRIAMSELVCFCRAR